MDNTSVTTVREEPSPCRIKLNIEVAQERVSEALDAAEREFRKYAKIPGFRPGKAPKSLLRRHYGKEIRQEAKRQLLHDCLQQGLDQEALAPATVPHIDNEDALTVEDNETFVFAAQFDIAPSFEVPVYKGLTVSRDAVNIDDTQIDRVIQSMLQGRVSYEKVERAAEDGDLLKVSYEGTLKNSEVEIPDSARFLLAAEETWVALREPEILPGATAQLRGAKTGTTHQISIEFPPDFYEASLAGNAADYAVQVLEVQAANVPDFTDEMAKEMGADDAMDAKQRIRQNLESRERMAAERAVRHQLVSQLMDKVDFPLPPGLLSREAYDILVRMYEDRARGGTSQEDLQEAAEELRTQAQEIAKYRLKRHYLLSCIAEAEGLKVEAQEVESMIDMLSHAQKTSPAKLRRQLTESGRIVDLIDELLDDKTVEHLLTLNNVEETVSGDGADAEQPA